MSLPSRDDAIETLFTEFVSGNSQEPPLAGSRGFRIRVARLGSEIMTISHDPEVDLDGLVADMLEGEPDEVSCPSRLPQYDFERIRDIIRRVIRMYHPVERNVPWQPGPRSMGGVALMTLIKNGDYQAADDYLVVEGSFLPA